MKEIDYPYIRQIMPISFSDEIPCDAELKVKYKEQINEVLLRLNNKQK